MTKIISYLNYLTLILFTYLLPFPTGKVGVFYNKITTIEKVMRTVVGGVFITTGVYYISIFEGIRVDAFENIKLISTATIP